MREYSGQQIQMKAIGTVRNGQREAVDEGWGGIVSTIELSPELYGVADGLEGFSHVLVVTWLHETPSVPEVRRRPRNRTDMPEVGLLAQRARHRPNPIGVTTVEVVAVQQDSIQVRGLDAIEGTPVLDLKPYYPVFDLRETATVPEWVDRLMKGYFSV